MIATLFFLTRHIHLKDVEWKLRWMVVYVPHVNRQIEVC